MDRESRIPGDILEIMQNSRSNPCLMIHHNQNRNTACVEHVGSVLAKERLTWTRQNSLIQSHAADASDVAIRRPAPIAPIPHAAACTSQHDWQACRRSSRTTRNKRGLVTTLPLAVTTDGR